MDADFLSWQDTRTQALLTATSEAGFGDALSACARTLGFEYASFGIRLPFPLSNPKVAIVNNYPEKWRVRYSQEQYVTVDPTVAHALRSSLPLVWNESMFALAPAFWEDARGHGLNVGWAQSSVDLSGNIGMLTLARSHDALGHAELRAQMPRMQWLAKMAMEGMGRLMAAQHPATDAIHLTMREIEVLRWTADGKTAGEVAQIMAISERTVNFHVNNALEKLGANNKTAGVVKAAMLRLL